DPLPPDRSNTPDESFDVVTGGKEQSSRRRAQLRLGRVVDQVVQRGLVGVQDVEVAGPCHQREEARGDRDANRAHGQNPAWIEKKNWRVGGSGPRSMLRVTACGP